MFSFGRVMRDRGGRRPVVRGGAVVEVREPEAFFSSPETDRAKDFLGKILHH